MTFFFFNDTATTEIYTLSLHDALPICPALRATSQTGPSTPGRAGDPHRRGTPGPGQLLPHGPAARPHPVELYRGPRPGLTPPRRWVPGPSAVVGRDERRVCRGAPAASRLPARHPGSPGAGGRGPPDF